MIFIDAGTTTEFLLPFLQAKNLTVVTNSIHHAARLVELSIETIIVGVMSNKRPMPVLVT